MTPDEFEQCCRRFGDNVSAWPVPYRQQGLELQGDRRSDEDETLDRLVLDAALMETDDAKLTRDVLARISAESGPRFARHTFLGFLLKPAAMAACLATLAVALSAGGYQLASVQGNVLESDLLAFAVGVPLPGNDLPAGGATWEEGR